VDRLWASSARRGVRFGDGLWVLPDGQEWVTESYRMLEGCPGALSMQGLTGETKAISDGDFFTNPEYLARRSQGRLRRAARRARFMDGAISRVASTARRTLVARVDLGGAPAGAKSSMCWWHAFSRRRHATESAQPSLQLA